jgi:flagellar biosynthesis protein FlhF
MIIKKIEGKSIQDAMKEAKALYGEDISVVETKTIKGGLFSRNISYAVVVSVPEETANENRKSRFQTQFLDRAKKNFDLKIDTTVDDTDDLLGFKFHNNDEPEAGSLLANSRDKKSSSQYPNQNNSTNLLKQGFGSVESKRVSQNAKTEQFIDATANVNKIMELVRKKQEENKVQRNEQNFEIDLPDLQIPNTNQNIKQPPQNSPILKTQTTPDINNNQLNDIKSELSQLNDKIKLIQNMFWEEKGPNTTLIPPEFSEIYRIAKQSGMNQEHLDLIMKLSTQHMPFKMRQSSETVKRYFKALLRKMIPIRTETIIKPPNKKIIMLVGSTGVGKTTTIAKLAARFALKSELDYKVGLIVLDTYKIGAVEQLTQYARMMKVQIETVVSPIDFLDKLERMRTNDYVLIDTMGSSPYDIQKIDTIREFLNTGNNLYEIEVMLVLSSSLKYEDLKESYNSFSKLNIDTIMFTKLDETKGFGNIFSLIHDVQKPISYFSIGQEVPEDIIVAKSEYLVDSLLHGFKRDGKSE